MYIYYCRLYVKRGARDVFTIIISFVFFFSLGNRVLISYVRKQKCDYRIVLLRIYWARWRLRPRWDKLIGFKIKRNGTLSFSNKKVSVVLRSKRNHVTVRNRIRIAVQHSVSVAQNNTVQLKQQETSHWIRLNWKPKEITRTHPKCDCSQRSSLIAFMPSSATWQPVAGLLVFVKLLLRSPVLGWVTVQVLSDSACCVPPFSESIRV